MYKTYNQEDGLWGLSLRLPKNKPLNRLVVEFLSTTDMSGPWHDLDGLIYGGADGYYNNGVYLNGWSFYGMTLGNPWLTSPKYNPNYEGGQVGFINNKVRVYHVAGTGSIGLLDYTAVLAYSRNYGTTQPVSVPTVCKEQFSWSLNTEMPFPYSKKTRMTLNFSGDRGEQYGNNYALLLGLRWEGRLTW
jgi:Capsule assembly protein Wzi